MCRRLRGGCAGGCATAAGPGRPVPADVDVDVDKDRGVIGRLLALAGIPVDEGVDSSLGQNLGHQQEIDTHPLVAMERTASVVPPREQAVLGIEATEHVDQSPGLQTGQCFTLRRAHVGHALECGRAPYIAVFGSHVEVPAHGHRLIG